MTHEQVSHPDRRAIACNLREAGRVAAAGALAYVRNPNFDNASERVEVLVRSRGGRWVQRWQDARSVTNFRAATIPPEHPRYDDPRMSFYEDADRRAEALYFHAGSDAVRGVGTRGRLGAARAGRELAGHDGGATAVAVTRYGRLALSGDGAGARRAWSPADGRLLHAPARHPERVTSLAVTPDGRLALSGSADGTAHVVDPAAGRRVRVLAHADGVQSVAMTADGRLGLTSSAGEVTVWDLRDGRALRRLPAGAEAVAFAGAGRLALLGRANGDVEVWDLVLGGCVRAAHCHHAPPSSVDWETAPDVTPVVALATTPDARRVLTAGADDPRIGVWDLRDGEHVDAPLSCDRSLRTNALAISPDGRVGLQGGTAMVVLYDLADDDPEQGRPRRGTHAQAALLDLRTGRRLAGLDGQRREIAAVALSACARVALTASLDGTVRVWHLRWGEEGPGGDWDAVAQRLLEDFVYAQTPYREPLELDGPLRGGQARWDERELHALMRELEDAGFPAFDPEIVEIKLRLLAGR